MKAVLQIRMKSKSFGSSSTKRLRKKIHSQAAACVVKMESVESRDRSWGNIPAFVSSFASFGFSFTESTEWLAITATLLAVSESVKLSLTPFDLTFKGKCVHDRSLLKAARSDENELSKDATRAVMSPLMRQSLQRLLASMY